MDKIKFINDEEYAGNIKFKDNNNIILYDDVIYIFSIFLSTNIDLSIWLKGIIKTKNELKKLIYLASVYHCQNFKESVIEICDLYDCECLKNINFDNILSNKDSRIRVNDVITKTIANNLDDFNNDFYDSIFKYFS